MDTDFICPIITRGIALLRYSSPPVEPAPFPHNAPFTCVEHRRTRCRPHDSASFVSETLPMLCRSIFHPAKPSKRTETLRHTSQTARTQNPSYDPGTDRLNPDIGATTMDHRGVMHNTERRGRRQGGACINEASTGRGLHVGRRAHIVP